MLGPVFRTHDPDHDRLAAVKAFTLDLTPEQAASLAAELQRLADLELDDPCVAAPLAAGVEEFVPYVAVPYVPGESLDAAIRQYGPAPAGDAIRLIAHVAEALDAAAHVGVFHGSLHPRDIIVTPGETHVTGIGVAQALEGIGLHGPIRRPYVAPEREGGDEWGAAADIYSLAAIAYEVLTGRRALPGTDQPLTALDDIRVHDAAALRNVIESALDVDPERRPARARDFAAAFAAALSEGGAAVPDERPHDKRARKPRTRPPKLPGLDEPLVAPGAARGRIREELAAAAAVPAPAPEVAPAPEPAGAGGAPGDIRYLAVSDPADAGDAAQDFTSLSVSMPDVSLEPEQSPIEAIALPGPVGAYAPGLEAGPTPDFRLADDLLPRAEPAGETVDAELAAALDRMSSEHGAGPTPAVIGIDLFAPGPTAPVAEELAGRGAAFDLAAEAHFAYHAGDGLDARTLPPGPVEAVDAQPESEERALDLSALEPPAAPAEATAGSEFDLSAIDAALPRDEPVAAVPEAASEPGAEPLRPFVRGSAAERRRSLSRSFRIGTPVPAPPPLSSGPEGEVPRVFDQARATPAERPAPDFELLTRPETSRPMVVSVLIGVVAGLIVGMAGGYWLGSRGATPAGAPPARAAAPSAPASSPAVLPAEPPAGPPAEPPAAAQQVPAEAKPVGPPATPASRPAGGEGAAATLGSVTVSAAPLQANVYLDGKRDGLTPRNLKSVPLGSHTIRVTRSGYVPQEQTVVLTAEAPTARLEFTLSRGGAPAAPAPAFKSVLTVLIASTPPGARIRIDGRDLSVTPLMVRQMRPGTHKIELRLAGYRPWSTTITVAAGDERQVTASLERDTSR